MIHASTCRSGLFSQFPIAYISLQVVADYGLETVQEYMYHIRNNAEMSVRNLLRDVVKRAGTSVLSAIDYLDDGTAVSPVSVYSDPRVLTASIADSAQGRY